MGGLQLKIVKIKNVSFHNYSMEQFIEIFNTRIKEKRKTFVVTANPEIVMYANKDPNYMETLLKADYIIPDGFGIIIASRILNQPLKERVAGFDLMCELLSLSEKNNYKVFLLGAKEKTLDKAYMNIKKAYPKLNIVGRHHGYFDLSDERVVSEVLNVDPDLIFVATGFPRQEYWIEKYIDRFHKGFFMGVGGSFDVWSGEVKRAPQSWINRNLEWLYRLIQQPYRIKRMLVLPKFLLEIIFERLYSK